jgi:hypothetical protein
MAGALRVYQCLAKPSSGKEIMIEGTTAPSKQPCCDSDRRDAVQHATDVRELTSK